MFIATVDDNKSKLSAHNFSRSRMTKDFIHYVTANLIPNCPITVNAIKNAEFIWGPDLGSLKGKTTKQPSPQICMESHSIPLQVMQQYKDVTLSAGVMKVTGILFLMTISKHIKFGTAGKCDNMNNSHTSSSISK